MTYEPAPADSDSSGAPAGATAATGSASSDGATTKPQAQPLSQYKMFCTPCRASNGVSASMRLPDCGLFRKYSKGPFVIGGTNMKRTTLTAHEASDGHSVAVEHERNRTARPGTSITEQSIQKMNRAVFDKLDKLFRNAHAIAKNNRPFSDYVWMATLDERKGLFLGETYRNEKACKEFIHSIANMEKDKVTAEMKDVKFITVVSDGSTDVSVSENEIVYLRCCRQGIPKTLFVSMQAVEKADANGIFMALAKSLSDIDVSPTKVVAFSADGASVNTGEANGVIAKMPGPISTRSSRTLAPTYSTWLTSSSAYQRPRPNVREDFRR